MITASEAVQHDSELAYPGDRHDPRDNYSEDSGVVQVVCMGANRGGQGLVGLVSVYYDTGPTSVTSPRIMV